jgi:hypothetical protein
MSEERRPMTTIRLSNGPDTAVSLSVEETLKALERPADKAGFIELPTDDGPIRIRPSAIVALFPDTHKGSAGFRVGASGTKA